MATLPERVDERNHDKRNRNGKANIMHRRDFLRSGLAFGGAAAVGLTFHPRLLRAQGQAGVIRVIAEGSPNTLDPAGTGYNIPSVNITWNVYDRLVTFGQAPLTGPGQEGAFIYDYDNIVPQAAESYEIVEDGKVIRFKLRAGATFHDGSPVTADDVKWSLDRAVNVTTAKNQMGTGSMTDPAQFVVVDDSTIEVHVERADRFTLPNLALLFPAIFNAKVAKEHATAEDPWATEWLKTNVAGGGPYKLGNYQAGQQFVLEPFADWKNGDTTPTARILYQIVPQAASRRIAAERGEADLVRDLPGRDIADLLSAGKVKVLGISNPATVTYIAMNNNIAPFNNMKVRQAVAWSVPYQDMLDVVLYKRGTPMFGGPAEVTSTQWPSPLPYTQDLDKAKSLLAEAGFPDGFESTFSIDADDTTVAEPVATLMQEALGKIGVKVRIDKIPAGQMGTLLTEKKLPLFIANAGAWLRSPDYFFRIFYQGETRWNFGSYANPEMIDIVAKARWETDPKKYDELVMRMIELARTEVPVIPLWSAFQDTVMSEAIGGYTYMFHRSLELRHLTKA
ncbi:peptide/nickel transport system substrate-binding protein [Mesorhizobium australicum]|uniref:Peptide/nickel transport system substrate-binding protein n=3 Tax=Mesorhizobium TaxID=68287 RepID=A0A1X7PQ22_9HYPH|nr:peptide/nickel transport system substrate-binding protein [Mesorhizobium australicum]